MWDQEKRVLKVAMIVDSVEGSIHDYDIAQWAATHPNVAITHLIIQELPDIRVPGGLVTRNVRMIRTMGIRRYLEGRVMRGIRKREGKNLKYSEFANSPGKRWVGNVVEGRIFVKPRVSKSGFIFHYAESDLAKIKAEGFDILLRCGTGILKGGILTASRLGILSFHHADNRVNRGVPPGFWEVYHKQPQTGFIIQKLTAELDGGNVLRRGAFPTKPSWLLNQASLYQKSNHYLKKLLIEIAERGELGAAEESLPYYNPLFTKPALEEQLVYLWRSALTRLKTKWNYEFLGKRQRWSVAYSKCHWRELVMRKAVEIPNPPGRFLADPFVVTRDGRDFCFVEDYDSVSGLGSISVFELGVKSAEFLGFALSEEFHLSYPYLFEFESKLFMAPEACGSRQIRVYECVEFPLEWKLASVVMDQVSAADPMIFQHDGQWWMFANVDPRGGDDHSSELSIYYSDNPLSQDWIPHGRNPIYIDPMIARNGGILMDGNRIFRVAQIPGFSQYGKSTKILEITKLTTTEYEEREVSSVQPNFFEGLQGTHHLHCNGTVAVFDYLRLEKF
jgi:hypothetical protein